MDKAALKNLLAGTSPQPLCKPMQIKINGVVTSVMVKGPSIKVMEKIQDETGVDLFDPGNKLFAVTSWLAIYCTCHPETGERILDESDRGWVAALPAGEWPSEVGAAAFVLFTEQQKKGRVATTGTLTLPTESPAVAPAEVRVVKQATQTAAQAAATSTLETGL